MWICRYQSINKKKKEKSKKQNKKMDRIFNKMIIDIHHHLFNIDFMPMFVDDDDD